MVHSRHHSVPPAIPISLPFLDWTHRVQQQQRRHKKSFSLPSNNDFHNITDASMIGHLSLMAVTAAPSLPSLPCIEDNSGLLSAPTSHFITPTSPVPNPPKSILKKVQTRGRKYDIKHFRFNSSVLLGEAHSKFEYDRKSDFVLHLTPQVATQIKMELNEFKSTEMPVHENSKCYTHLFVMK